MPEHIISLQNINKHFADDKVLNAISLDIYNSEFITLLGPSGCGKTTLLRLLAGFEQPSSGSIFINSAEVTNIPAEKRQVNMVFQSYALFPHMSVYDNVAFGLRCDKVATKTINQEVSKALQTVKLEHLASRKPNQLSGGQQQRVAIARAIVKHPLVLLLDEPLSALDYKLRKEMQLELKEIQRQLGITFILVTHDQDEALSMSDRIVVMDKGHIIQVGTPRDIYEEPTNLFVAQFIGEVNIFDSDVLNSDNTHIMVNIEGKSFQLEKPGNIDINDKLHIVIRPEDVCVWDEDEAKDRSQMLHGKVEQVIYKGSTVDLLVRLDSGKLIAATEFFNEDDEDLEYTRNESVWIEWTKGWEVILPR